MKPDKLKDKVWEQEGDKIRVHNKDKPFLPSSLYVRIKCFYCGQECLVLYSAFKKYGKGFCDNKCASKYRLKDRTVKVKLHSTTYTTLKDISEKNDRSVNDLIKDAIELYVIMSEEFPKKLVR